MAMVNYRYAVGDIIMLYKTTISDYRISNMKPTKAEIIKQFTERNIEEYLTKLLDGTERLWHLNTYYCLEQSYLEGKRQLGRVMADFLLRNRPLDIEGIRNGQKD